MKKIITASLVAMMAVTAAHADIASTTYVDSRTGNPAKDLTTTAKNLTGAVNELAGKLSSGNLTIAEGAVGTNQLADDAVTSAKIDDGTIVNADIAEGAAIDQSKIAGLGDALNAKVDKSVYDAHLTTQSGVDSGQNANIKALQDSIAAGGDTTKAIEAAATAAAAAQQTADGAVTVNTQQGEAITALQNSVNNLDGTFATDDQAADAAKAATDALNLTSVGAEGSFISTVSQTKGIISAGKTAFVDEISTATQDSTIAPQTKAVKAYVDGQITQIDDDLTDELAPIKQSVTDLEGFKTGLGTAATKEALENNVVTSVTTKDGKVTSVGSAQITNAMVAAGAAIEKSKLASGVQESLGKADTAMQLSALKDLASWGEQNCATTDVTCSLVSKSGNIAWEAVKY